MGLDIGRLGAEQRLGALDCERFYLIDELAAPIVASTRIALGVLVGEDGALRLEDRLAHHVLGGDQLEVVLLPLGLSTDRRVNRRVDAGQRGERGGTRIGHSMCFSAARHARGASRAHRGRPQSRSWDPGGPSAARALPRAPLLRCPRTPSAGSSALALGLPDRSAIPSLHAAYLWLSM